MCILVNAVCNWAVVKLWWLGKIMLNTSLRANISNMDGSYAFQPTAAHLEQTLYVTHACMHNDIPRCPY